MRRAVGEGVEPSRSGYVIANGSHTLRHRDKEVCLPVSPSYSMFLFSFVDTNISTMDYLMQIF